MPTEKKIRRRGPAIDVRQAVRDWLLNDDAVKSFSERLGEARKRLLTILEETGTTDDAGHQWLRFPDDPVEGRVKAIKRERRVGRRLNDERTEEYLRKRKLYDQCTETITVLSEEKVLALNFAGKISDADLDGLYDINETFAFVPQRVKL